MVHWNEWTNEEPNGLSLVMTVMASSILLSTFIVVMLQKEEVSA